MIQVTQPAQRWEKRFLPQRQRQRLFVVSLPSKNSLTSHDGFQHILLYKFLRRILLQDLYNLLQIIVKVGVLTVFSIGFQTDVGRISFDKGLFSVTLS